MFPSGLMDDVANTQNADIGGYICEWDHAPTRETVYQSEASIKQESEDIEVLQAATLKHNEMIVSQRERLQSAILAADDEAAITDAKASYNARVVLIKKAYIEQMQGVLKKTLEEDRLNLASNIKTQILRVQGQVSRLSKVNSSSAVPALDDGDAETTPEQQPTPGPNGNPPAQDPADPSIDDADNTGTFFGIPLE